MSNDLKVLADRHTSSIAKMGHAGVRLINYDPESPYKVAAALLFEYCDAGLHELQEYCRTLPEEELSRILDSASNFRENRRHKSPRALEHAVFSFEIVADFGAYRDLHRHRMLTQDRQLLTCDFGYFIPHVGIVGTEMEKQYRDAIGQETKKNLRDHCRGAARRGSIRRAHGLQFALVLSCESPFFAMALRTALRSGRASELSVYRAGDGETGLQSLPLF